MRFSFLAFALLCAASCSTAPPPPPAPLPVRMLDEAAQIETVPAPGYAFSHDGRTLIFSASIGGEWRPFSISISGGQPTPIGAVGTRAISYFPNDDRILLRLGQGLIVRQDDRTISTFATGNFLGWCDNGDAMIFSDDALLRVDGASHEQRAVLTLPEGQRVAAVSRDCRWAAIEAAGSGQVLIGDLSAPSPTARSILAHTANTAYGVFGFTPTNRSLNYAQRAGSGFQEAYRYQLTDGQSFLVMQTQADVLAIEFSPTGRYGAYYSGANGQIADMTLVDQTSDQAVPLSSGTRDLRFSRDETKIAFRLANDGWPNDIFVSDLDGGHITRLVHAPNARP